MPLYTTPTCEDYDDDDNPLTNDSPNFFEKSDVSGFNKMNEFYLAEDYCSGNTINDFVCENLVFEGQDIGKIPTSKQYACPDGTTCAEKTSGSGKVIFECIPIKNNESSICIDSDKTPDNTPDFKTKGFVMTDGSSWPDNDVCAYSDTKIVDYVCENNKSVQKTFKCEEGKKCKEITDELTGKKTLGCVSVCEDLDEDNNIEIQGMVTNYETSKTHPDVCNGNTLYQYQCNSVTDAIEEVLPEVDCLDNKYGGKYSGCCGGKCCKGACIDDQCVQ